MLVDVGLDFRFSFKYDAIPTIISFLTYKEWLLLFLDRHPEIALEYFKGDIALRLDIYKQM